VKAHENPARSPTTKAEDIGATLHRVRSSTGLLPTQLEILPASLIRQWIPETCLWRFEKSGELPALRIGRRRYYRRSDWEAFLNRAAKTPPAVMPWTNQKKS